ncbi:MAG: DUF2656 domain-containing protein [Stenomitos rutilans HA7619-LM2]|jgi:hypothetical protein|nr:DUF2656 domain-containing protein [Stenomitos rutilans HA7619-LM2]
MLLSHNFDVLPDTIPALSRQEFAAVFQVGLSEQDHLQCRMINHPHWIVEIQFPPNQFLPSQVGALCAKALAEKRRSQQLSAAFPEILVLGGIKTTPPTTNSPEALQPGEWGVDVVETRSREAFLQGIGWDATIAQKPIESVFKIEWQED